MRVLGTTKTCAKYTTDANETQGSRISGETIPATGVSPLNQDFRSSDLTVGAVYDRPQFGDLKLRAVIDRPYSA